MGRQLDKGKIATRSIKGKRSDSRELGNWSFSRTNLV